jgi:hypothetical protein
VPDQARSRGFCASYWLADPATGSGLGLSMWEGPAELSDSALNSRHRRRRFEDLLGCKVNAVAEYQALGVAQRPVGTVPTGVDGPDRSTDVMRELLQHSDLGTTIECPPGALLAVRGDRTYQVVYLLDGRAAIVHDEEVEPMSSGAHFGAQAAVQPRANGATILATSPVRVHVFSRTEFSAVANRLPTVADELIAHDMDR